MMKIVTQRELIRSVAERWYRQYQKLINAPPEYKQGDPPGRYTLITGSKRAQRQHSFLHGKMEIYRKLKALNLESVRSAGRRLYGNHHRGD